jgi:hypothetical protein
MYTAIPACFPWFHASMEVLKRECVDNLLRFFMDLLSHVKTTPFQPLISSWGIGKCRREARSDERGGITAIFFKSRIVEQRVMCERASCHGGETNCSCTYLDVCAGFPPLAASKSHGKTCRWRFDQGVWIPFGQFLGWRKKRSTWTWRCCELDTLFSAAVNLVTSIATTAA